MKNKLETLFWPAKLGIDTAKWLGGTALGWLAVGERFGKSLAASQDRKELALSAREIIEEGVEKPKVFIMALRGQNKSAAKIAISGYMNDFETGEPISEERKLSIKVAMDDYMPNGTTFESLGYGEAELAVLCEAFPEFCAEKQEQSAAEAALPEPFPEEPSFNPPTDQTVPIPQQETEELKLF